MTFRGTLLSIGVLLFVLTTACAGGGPPSSGELLPGTEGAHKGSEFSLSPDNRWLLLRMDASTLSRPKYELYDLESRQGEAIGFSPAVQSIVGHGGMRVGGPGCWLNASEVYIGGGPVIYARPDDRPLAWRRTDPLNHRLVRAVSKCEQPKGRFSVRGQGGSIDVIGPSGSLVSTHSTWPVSLGRRLVILELAPSPNERLVAYSVSSNFEAIALGKTAYVAGGARGPGRARALSRSIYGNFRWSPDGQWLYAICETRAGRPGIYRWSSDELG